MKKRIIRIAWTVCLALVLLSLTACGEELQPTETEKHTRRTREETAAVTETESGTAKETDDRKESDPAAETQPESGEESQPETPAESFPETRPAAPSEEPQIGVFKKITGGADNAGIYAIVIRMGEKAADKGTVEMIYYGAKGTPQEKSVVNTFRIEYWKDTSGLFEIRTYYDGEVYQNQHQKSEVKVVNEFGADLRAGEVIISYAPEGEALQEYFRCDADYFR